MQASVVAPRSATPAACLLRAILACAALLACCAPCAATVAPAAQQVRPVAGRPAAGPSHIFLILMENKEASDVLGSADAPYLNALASGAAVADQYYAVGHPSLPNYLALVSGDTLGVTSDCTDCFQDAPNLADALEATGLTWESYEENLPYPCYLGAQAAGLYALKHNPFLYFSDVRDDPSRCARSVPLDQFADDLAAGSLPNFSFITPNLVHDSHDGSVADGDRWLAGFVPQLLASDAWERDGALIITWDEGGSDRGCCGRAGGGRVPLVVLTPDGPVGYHARTPASHYSLLRTIEELWGLAYLGHSGDADVASLQDLFVATSATVAGPAARDTR